MPPLLTTPVPLEPAAKPNVNHDKDGNPIDSVLVLGVRRLAVDTSVTASITNVQIQTVEAIGLLAGGASFNGSEQDSLSHEAFSASLTVSSTLGTTVTVRFQQRAAALATFRDADVIDLNVPAGGAPGPLINLDRVWSVSRQFVRVRVENTGANPLTTAELITLRKPIS